MNNVLGFIMSIIFIIFFIYIIDNVDRSGKYNRNGDTCKVITNPFYDPEPYRNGYLKGSYMDRLQQHRGW